MPDKHPENVLDPKPPLSQAPEPKRKRKRLFHFTSDFPKRKLPDPNPNFQLIPEKDLEKLFNDKNIPPNIRKEIKDDMAFLEEEMFHLFTKSDYQAKSYQNDYRRYQLWFILLAFFATLVGSFQAVVSGRDVAETWLPALAFVETVIALLATFVSTVSASDPPMNKWIQNRRIAEYMRQEYFRYLTGVDPYDEYRLDQPRREMLLARRVAEINQGKHPDIDMQSESSGQGV